MVVLESPADYNVTGADDITIDIRDWPGGRERVRFNPPEQITGWVDVSADAGRLLAERGEMYPANRFGSTLPDPQQWYVFDGRGRLLTTISSTEPGTGPDGGQSATLSPDGTRVVRLLSVQSSGTPGPYPTMLVFNDAETGAERGRVDLPGLEAGTWTTDRMVGSEPVKARRLADASFSPDGRRLALVHPDADAVTLVDVERMTVERTVAIGQPGDGVPPEPRATPSPDDLFDPFPPEDWRWAGAEFSPDGRALYVFGYAATVAENGGDTCGDLPLRRVDLETGIVETAAVSDTPLVADDGESVYTMGYEVLPGACSFYPTTTTSILRRLDADMLAVLAEREFRDDVWVALIPPADGRRP